MSVEMLNDRIKQGRKLRGLSLRDLGARIGKSHETVRKYETGKIEVDSSTLLDISRALDLSTEFFLRPEYLTTTRVPAYRSHPGFGPRRHEAVVAAAGEVLERYLNAALLTKTSVVDPLPEDFPVEVEELHEVEEVAERLRRAWKLGYDPIHSLVALLEERGIPVLEIDETEGFDACTVEFESPDGRGWAIIIDPNVPGDRLRFSVAHELGHLVLNSASQCDPEKAANRFAAAFLVPRWAAEAELGTQRKRLTLRELYYLKHEYGLSMQSWIHRADELDVLSTRRARELRRELDAVEGPKREPGTQLPPERPRRLRQMLERAVAEEILSERKAADLAGQSLDEWQTSRRTFDHEMGPRRQYAL